MLTAKKRHSIPAKNDIFRLALTELAAITYGAALPEDLAANMAAVLEAAGGTADV